MDALQYARELVAFESTSSLSNVEVTDYVEAALVRLGFATERIDFVDDNGVAKSNVVGKKGSGRGGMAYFGHTDVVPADNWHSSEHGPFEPVVMGDKLYGRGSCDMKGSVACMLAAAEAVAAAELKQPLYVTCTADEEVGYGGARQVAQRSEFYQEMLSGDSHGIIGEPTLLDVVYAHKGTCGFYAISHGRAAHSSTREGKNANLAMIPFLVEIKQLYDETETDPAWRNDEFDPPTISWNIGINDHTRAINITPPQSVCTVYFRPMPGQQPEILAERARAAAEKCGIEFVLDRTGPPLYTDPNSDYVRQTLKLTGAKTARTVAYGTDGSVFSQMKNLVVLGPGGIAQAHTNDEWISLDQLRAGFETYSKLIRHWCCQA